MEEYTALVGHATREQTEQLTTLKSVLLNINGRNMIYNAMRFQEMNGLILKRLYFFCCRHEDYDCKNKEDAYDLLDEFLR